MKKGMVSHQEDKAGCSPERRRRTWVSVILRSAARKDLGFSSARIKNRSFALLRMTDRFPRILSLRRPGSEILRCAQDDRALRQVQILRRVAPQNDSLRSFPACGFSG